ncbi:hypothetical protein SAMN06273567_103222 [Geodermatophilus aquaeductus]|uniref:Clumping factor A n=1 Tax=Geodermatophilus aquaeductus TaxID=1564161 RepID=A0A521DHI2_9ACTN|nr:hypothetical protein [Geodermatophilus aquaeductus]SMO71088.1 hypothetical protein SAMN06273567_103222 [Geodermatophilus aquaeductus]
MVVAAGLLVLAGLGLFVAGVLTAVTAWYWACVAACALAAVLLVVARLRAPAGTRVPARRPEGEPQPARSAGRTTAASTTAGAAEVAPPTPAAGGPATGEEPTGRHGRHEAPADAGEPAAAPERPERRESQAPAQPPVAAARPTTAASGNGSPAAAAADQADPPEEDVEVTDLLKVMDLTDEVLVVDEHPRYHLADCPWLAGRETIPLPVKEARTDGFTPCGRCGPDRFLADAERARRARRT